MLSAVVDVVKRPVDAAAPVPPPLRPATPAGYAFREDWGIGALQTYHGGAGVRGIKP